MSETFLLIVILFPLLFGASIAFIPFRKRAHMTVYTEIITVITTLLCFLLICNRPTDQLVLFTFVEKYNISFRMDGMSMVFAGLVSSLWPLATLYSFEYMEHEANEKTLRESTFFAMYTMTFGITLGIALASNMLTMYIFYEMLTLITVPLIIFSLSREAILASRKYLYYSLGGAAFAFIGLVFLMKYGDSIEFVLGGVLNMDKVGDRQNVLRLIYVFAFFGFGVKAAVWPLNSWLPQAGVAPTPVTALLHAVAVVKSGAFAILRLTYYSFGTDFLRGSFAQYVPMAVVIFTIVYGCSMAVKERHIKRRLAYSTISNLSYILFGALVMTPLGMIGALSHMIFHGVMKICSFFCAGAIICKTGKTYVYELDGLGRRMPKTFCIFTISALALMGVPGLCGFISKWNLANAAVESGVVLNYVGIAALLISALLTAIYMLQIVIRAFFPQKGFDESSVGQFRDPGWKMLVPLTLFVIAMILFGLYSAPLTELFGDVAAGLL